MIPSHLDDAFYDLGIELVDSKVDLVVKALFM
jgi:hypothetical protein